MQTKILCREINGASVIVVGPKNAVFEIKDAMSAFFDSLNEKKESCPEGKGCEKERKNIEEMSSWYAERFRGLSGNKKALKALLEEFDGDLTTLRENIEEASRTYEKLHYCYRIIYGDEIR